ncbi:MAG: hypothetical protein QNJ53_00570 [Pleurocapsa sp. MO_192.B19]|nr:hypothetical protein [Pleurocapsa sp. MO_192.B19]
MQSTDQSFASPDLEAAIDRKPLIIRSDISLTEAIALMGMARGTSCKVELDSRTLAKIFYGMIIDYFYFNFSLLK